MVVTDPDDAQIVFKHEHSQKKPFMYMFAKEWVGNGIITAETEVWKPHRKLIALTFNRKILEHYMHIFETQSNIFVEQLAPHCGTNNYIDVFNYASRLTLDIICGKENVNCDCLKNRFLKQISSLRNDNGNQYQCADGR